MGHKNIIFGLLICLKLVFAQDSSYYTAAVVGFANNFNVSEPALYTLRNNTEMYKNYISQAKQAGADIIVFPEYGLTSLGFFSKDMDKADLLPISTLVPIEKFQNPNPCDNIEIRDQVSEVVAVLSCAAKERNIYLVVNLIERNNDSNPDKVLFYNTNLVFDRKGAIIARYRKFNLYSEPYFTAPNEPEEVTFETDFGVKFGIFTCFEILFEKPALSLVQKNITHFIYPTAWLSELPFFSALQVQSGFARSNNVNLLAAGLISLKEYAGGSGIYSTQNITTNMPLAPQTTITIAKVPKTRFEVKPMTQPDERRIQFAPALRTMLRDIREYSYENLTQTNNVGSVAHKNFTCAFEVMLSEIENKNYTYKVVAYQGPLVVDGKALPTQICGVVACTNHSLNSCGYINYDIDDSLPSFPNLMKVNLTANFGNHKNSVVMPSLIDYHLNTVQFSDYTFEKNKTTTLVLNKPKTRMMTVGIAAHTFPNGASFIEISKLSVLLAAILILKQLF